MLRLQAYKFHILPNGEQQRAMRRFAGNARKVWNLALARQQEKHALGEKFTNAFGMSAWLLEWKKEYPFLVESPSQTLQQVMGNLQSGFKNFFEKRAAHPEFKKKGKSSDSVRFPQGFEIDAKNNRIKLPKLGWIRYRNSRDILGTPKNITVSCVAGKWYAAIQTEREVEDVRHPASTSVGIDVGIARFATLSDGSHIEPLNSFKKHQARLARYQRAMARKVKFSSNWKKAKAKVTKLHQKIGHVRQDFLHKTSTILSKNHALIVIEDLKVRNMSRSASGTKAVPGRSVRAKSGLNRSILDQGWGEFRRQLEYKQARSGGDVLAVNPRNTSRTCPACGHVSAENRRTQARFACVECGYENNADVVGAINILERGHRLLACGEVAEVRRSVKQEPTEVTTGELALV